MIGPVSAPFDNGPLSGLVADAADVRRQLAVVTQQSADGLAADAFGGLGAAARTPLDLGPQVAHAAAYQAGIDAASGRLGVAQAALSQIAGIASAFKANLAKLDGVNAQEADGLAQDAQSALRQVAGLLNSKAGDVYVFAGQDTSTPPVANADGILQSSFFRTIEGAVGNLPAVGAAGTAAATLAVPAPIAPSGAPPVVQVGPGERMQAGVLAGANTLAVSAGPSTTGSYMRDLMRALATIGAITSATPGGPELQALVQDTRTSLQGAITAMGTEAGALGNLQAGMATRKTEWSATQTALTQQLSAADDVDMAATLTRLSTLQTQLQASYKVIAAVKGLTLADIL